MMASSTAIRFALTSRGHAPTAATALSTSSAAASNYFSPSLPSASSQNTLSQKRSHHRDASSSSTQFVYGQWNGCNQLSFPIRNSGNASILKNSCINDIRWFSSKTDAEAPSSSTTTNDDEATNNNSPSGSSQHNTWVEFQKSIAVSGFETGQTVREQTFGKKSRGGKIDRKRKEREAELEAALRGADNTQVRPYGSSKCSMSVQ